ncbi:hypothetical protein R5H30_01080 [Sulfitobacter sp. D35]|uniref:hypothetical protein n=1 Tax=Sulfitobacter sp. D35 TaxID=3083252 RepID=UPI00296F2129|nr:hypothetical protein [Sulfitobacter sp. D35]MDW4496557.1 hypothetical protein [Sulfitobacter sp. D35]
MAKPPFDLAGILGTEPPDNSARQMQDKSGPSKRLSLVLDAETYAALRQRAFAEETTHQALCELAVRLHLGLA